MIRLTRFGLSGGGAIRSTPAIVITSPVPWTRRVVPADTDPSSSWPTARVNPLLGRSNTSSTVNLADTVPPFKSCLEPLVGWALDGVRLVLQPPQRLGVDGRSGPVLFDIGCRLVGYAAYVPFSGQVRVRWYWRTTFTNTAV